MVKINFKPSFDSSFFNEHLQRKQETKIAIIYFES